MLSVLRKKLRYLYSRICWLLWKRPRSKVVIKRFRKLNCKGHSRTQQPCPNKTTTHSNSAKPIRIATFNVAMFSLAPAVSEADELRSYNNDKSSSIKVDCPKSILKQSPLHASLSKANLKVSINLPENEISLANSRLLASMDNDDQVPARSPVCFPPIMNYYCGSSERFMSSRSILEVLREIDADVLALQDVKAEEEKNMKPLSDLAGALGMKFVFAESWAPEYGNAILSKWPIKRWKVQKIADDDDFRNVLKATIDVPGAGEINFHSTQLDHLDENWRMKQVNAITSSNDPPHILAGGLNSLDGTDYSAERWTNIVKYYEKLGKPGPKTQVMNYMKSKDYVDAKDYAGECESIVMMTKGQNVQGTCKYGTRVDYILSSPNSPYKFVPGSYSVISSKGTSDHHIVKVDITKLITAEAAQRNVIRRCRKLKQKVKKIAPPCSATSVWELTPPPKIHVP
ncbi:endonuclease/exonuclease/phosphatase family protein [Senna tora]|uniref:Endonuclease/exonuclease/phosphatase family protein n=1 Tax=Senna tora TaxID=362788 RepID=A0A834X2K0_9FABA|nr:endonuclease/exonuclease/phosphatase family protein [Senna tora]